MASLPAAWAQPASQDTVRVRLLEERTPRAVRVTAVGGSLNLYAGSEGSRLMQLPAGEKATISQRGNELHLVSSDRELYALSLRFVPAAEATFALQVTQGRALDEARRYPGNLHVRPDPNGQALLLVNHLPLETYVASVLGSEYGLNDEEGAKAMAVAIRTYALRPRVKFDGPYEHVDQVQSQRYMGTQYLTEATRRAARQTRGEVITHNGELIEATYFSSSGGHTADNEKVWEGQSLPYLRGKQDPYDEAASPHDAWTKSLPRQKLLRVLSDAHNGQVTGFVIQDRSPDGRVHSIELLRQNASSHHISGTQFRRLVNRQFGYPTLRSTFFEARREGDEYVFEGKGYGHGVGLSQWGAHEMAQRGRSYKDILQFYYTDVALQSRDEVERSASPAVASSASPSSRIPPEPTVSTASAPSDSLSPARIDTTRLAPSDTTKGGLTDLVRKKEETSSTSTRRIGW